MDQNERRVGLTNLLRKRRKNQTRKKKSEHVRHEECGSHIPQLQAYESIHSFNEVLMVCWQTV